VERGVHSIGHACTLHRQVHHLHRRWERAWHQQQPAAQSSTALEWLTSAQRSVTQHKSQHLSMDMPCTSPSPVCSSVSLL
jgi:hypothetical protein